MRKRTGRQYKDPTVPTKKRSEPIRKDVQPRVPFFTRLEELIGIFTFQWISPLMTRGGSIPAVLPDSGADEIDRTMDKLCENFDVLFRRHVVSGARHPLMRTLRDILWPDIWASGMFQLLSALLQLLVPFLIRYLISCTIEAHDAFDQRQDSAYVIQGLGFVFAISCTQICQTVFASQFLFRGQRLSCQTRVVLMNQILSKKLRLCNKPSASSTITHRDTGKSSKEIPNMAYEDEWTNTQLYTLITSEVTRVQNAWEMLHYVWTAPISIGVATLTLKANIGKSAFWGCTIVVLGITVITVAMERVAKSKRLITKLTDQRASMTHEVSNSIHLLKIFGWESKFMQRFVDIREQETGRIQIIHRTLTWIRTVWVLLPTFATMGSLIAYSMSSDTFEPMSIFSTLATFNALRPLLNMLPHVIGQVTSALDSSSHVESFLLEDEPEDYIQKTSTDNFAIRLNHATLSWYKTSEIGLQKNSRIDQSPASKASATRFMLRDFSLVIHPGEMLAVVGVTGSGKSSFLEGLMGNMDLVEGSIQITGNAAYCSQHTWMQNASVRDNILFGRDYDPVRYKEVLRACALQTDLEELVDGDQTQVGERGTALSGGQKSRISIARAVYAQTDILIMDDPFSSIDSNVGQHIIENLLCGILKHQCRIISTHNPSIIRRCDRILIIDEGRIKAIGSLDQHVKNGLLENHLISPSAEECLTSSPLTRSDAGERVRENVRTTATNSSIKFIPPAEVSWDGWKTYLAAGGTRFNCLIILLSTVIGNGMGQICSSWLSYWTSAKYSGLSSKQHAAIYAALSIGQGVFLAYSTTSMMARGITASKYLVSRATARVLRAPIAYFETGSLGIVLQQMAADTAILDTQIFNYIRLFSMKVVTISMVIAVTIYHCHYFLLAVGPFLHIFQHVARRYRRMAVNLHRLKLKRRSILYAKVNETLSGMRCIRSYGVWSKFKGDFRKDLRAWNEIHLLSSACPRWLTIRLDTVGIALTSLVGILSVVPWFGLSPSISGMLITNILSISQTLPLAMRNMHDTMNSLRVVEGMVYYQNNIPQEDSTSPGESESSPSSWDRNMYHPRTGQIEFQNVSMRYRPELPLALNSINLDVRDGEKLAIVGRTGAGKSSILATLLRLTEISDGKIEIDGTDISSMRLKDLRSAIAVIPQDVTLFVGSVRSNVDPFNEYNDSEIYSALERVKFVDDQGKSRQHENETHHDSPSSAMNHALGAAVKEGGANISLGNQQKIALARVLLRNSKIVVCDEATSAVDHEMDEHIQQTITQVFHQKTILYITHRIRTAFHCDRVCVMGQGRILEVGSPAHLWSKTEGDFRAMCDQSGMSENDVFKQDSA